jgi:hypothetical protein
MMKSVWRRLWSTNLSRRIVRPCRLFLELLESRTTPTTFDWNGLGGNNLWETPGNWVRTGGNPGDYPGWDATAGKPTTGDVVKFMAFQANAIMQKPHELASLQITNLYRGTITLQDQLTLNQGGSMVSATIVQKTATANGPITITGGTFTWSGGSI